MKITQTDLPGVFLVEPRVHGDHRGWFCETYVQEKYVSAGLDAVWIQDNHSFSAIKGTLRGLHFQNDPQAQTKLVRCTRGSILDVAVDLRKGSPYYGQWIKAVLSADNHLQLYIPRGFGHGFVTLEENTEVQYKVDAVYAPDCDRSIRYDDPAIGIDWGDIQPIISDKDRRAPLLRDSDCNFIYHG